MDYRALIAKNIDEQIKYSGKTKTFVAQELGVDRVTIIDYTKGRAVPSTLLIRKLCKILDCNYEDVLGSLEN